MNKGVPPRARSQIVDTNNMDYEQSDTDSVRQDWRVNVREKTLQALYRIDYVNLIIVLFGLLLAVALRFSLIEYRSIDYFGALKSWYIAIKSEGFSVFATDFSNYNPPFLYLLYIVIRFLPDTPPWIAVKIPALTADFACAYLVYHIVRIKYAGGLFPLLAGLAVLFAPTVALNSAFWGQADSLFTAGLLACIYFLMTRKPRCASLSFGIAIAFKLQAIFLAPLLVALSLRKMVSWKTYLFIPFILVLALVPTWVAGRPFLDLLKIYPSQASQYESLTLNAPTVYAWVPDTKRVFNLLYIPGVIMGAIAAFVITVIIYKSRNEPTPPLTLELALISLLVIPFFLPKMHERYFYPADVISIAFAFYSPQYYFIPLAIGAISFFSYEPFLFNIETVPLSMLAMGLLLIITILARHAVILLYRSDPERTASEQGE